jgi:hypothetical protein
MPILNVSYASKRYNDDKKEGESIKKGNVILNVPFTLTVTMTKEKKTWTIKA